MLLLALRPHSLVLPSSVGTTVPTFVQNPDLLSQNSGHLYGCAVVLSSAGVVQTGSSLKHLD